MKLSVTTEDEKEYRLIQEVKKYLDIFSEDGCNVTVCQKPEAGYEINKTSAGFHITYHILPELLRALLFLSAGNPSVEEGPAGEKIAEQCVFDDFGVMLDVSRNAVLNQRTLKKMIFNVACMGYHFLGLYMEDTLKVEEEPYLGYMRGSLTGEEIREADEYAKVFGIELRPYIQTLAHINQITRYEEYQKITDTKDILLAGEDRTEQFLDHIFKAVSECFSTRKINIGMDEAELVGAGKYLEKHGFEEKSVIMQKHLEMIQRLCRKYEFKPQMWGDMFYHLNIESKEKTSIPEGIELFYWDYYSTEKEHYSKKIEEYQTLTDNIGFAGGAWKWTGFVPHNGYSIGIGKAAITACREKKVAFFVVTCWGDNGAEASSFSVLPALYADANEAYESKMHKRGFELLTGYTFEEFMNIDLVNPYSEKKGIHNNSSKYLLFNDPLYGTFDSVIKSDTVRYFEQTEAVMERLSKKGSYSYLFSTMRNLCRVLKKKADLGRRIRAAYEIGDMSGLKKIGEEDIPWIIHYTKKLYDSMKRQWNMENKPFGFEVQSIRFGGLIQRLEDVSEKLEQYTGGEISCIEELDEKQLPFHYFEENEVENLNYNLWSDIVSPSVIG